MLIYELLQKDHDGVRHLLEELIELDNSNKERKHTLIEQIRNELIPHARAEEAVFYNTLRSMDAAKDLVRHGYKEHLEAEAILRMLQVRDKIDADWKETAQKLKDALEHHIREEETNIFNAAKQLFTSEEADMMGEAFEKLKHEVAAENDLSTTVDLIANLMPTRFTETFRKYNPYTNRGTP